MAFGKYTRLFDYLDKTPKRYTATIWLGAVSSSFDIENIESIVHNPKRLDETAIKKELDKLVGNISYTPPRYSAKHIDGDRAYAKARAGESFELPGITSTIYEVNFKSYCHPFITVDMTVGSGTYIRSLAQILLQNLQAVGSLSSLHRVAEGRFVFDDEKSLNPLKYLCIKQVKYTGDKLWIQQGKKIDTKYLQNYTDGLATIVFDDFFAIVDIRDDIVKYVLNDIAIFDKFW